MAMGHCLRCSSAYVFFLTFAIGAALAARNPSRGPFEGFLLSSLALAVCVLIASALHVDRSSLRRHGRMVRRVRLAALSFAGALWAQRRA